MCSFSRKNLFGMFGTSLAVRVNMNESTKISRLYPEVMTNLARRYEYNPNVHNIYQNKLQLNVFKSERESRGINKVQIIVQVQTLQ